MTRGWNSCSDQLLESSAAPFPRNRRRNKVRFLGGDLKIGVLIFIWISEDKSRSFHATQGPLPNTCGSFWEMVWEQRSRGVVMLNRVIEKGSVSCLLLTVNLLPGYPVCHAEDFPSFCCTAWHEPSGQMCSVLASAGGKRHRLRGYKLQARFCLGRHQILLHGPSAAAGTPDRECLNDAARLWMCVWWKVRAVVWMFHRGGYVATSFSRLFLNLLILFRN